MTLPSISSVIVATGPLTAAIDAGLLTVDGRSVGFALELSRIAGIDEGGRQGGGAVLLADPQQHELQQAVEGGVAGNPRRDRFDLDRQQAIRIAGSDGRLGRTPADARGYKKDQPGLPAHEPPVYRRVTPGGTLN